MSNLKFAEKQDLEKYLLMSGGLVLNFDDRTFGEFVVESVSIDIHDDKYKTRGTSKANKLRALWQIESDYVAGRLIQALIIHSVSMSLDQNAESKALEDRCRCIAKRLIAENNNLESINAHALIRDSRHLKELILRMEISVSADPALAIGTAKELVESCCKTILDERGKTVEGNPDMPKLTKDLLKALNLVPEGIRDSQRGAEVIKRLLRSVGSIGNDLNELRGLYGTGHGKDGKAGSLGSRHARLAVATAAAFCTFIFDTHEERGSAQGH